MTQLDTSDWLARGGDIPELLNRLGSGSVPHAMLLTGKAEDAIHFTEYLAKWLLCIGDRPPCGECDACKMFSAQTHPDYHVLEAERGSALKTAQIEALQDRLRLRAHTGRRTVYVIRGIDLATPVAANRLLKILEEPSANVVAVLTAGHPQRVLSTVRSRCFWYRLPEADLEPVWDDPFSTTLHAAWTDPENGEFAGVLKQVVEWTQALQDGKEPALLLASSLLKISATFDVSDVLQLLSAWLRDVMHVATGHEAFLRFASWKPDLERQAARWSVAEIGEAIRLTVEARKRLQSHVAVNLNVEQFCIRLRGVFGSVHHRRGPVQTGR